MPELVTNDGVRLRYRDEGSGAPLVIVPGWSQTASMFEGQVTGLADRYRVIVLDHRGHGESEKPAYGYRIARLSKDLHELLAALELEDVNLLGWSMGCSVVWSYYDLFGPERLARLVLVDEPAFLCQLPEMSPADIANAGALWDAGGAIGVYEAVRTGQEAFVREFVAAFLTDHLGDVDRLSREVLKTPAHTAAALVLNHIFNDWRDVIPRIQLPTLVFAATKSHVPVTSQEWLQETIPDARLEIMDGRAHLMFYEDPDGFNRALAAFLG
jgi:non-heme chloroperoxidase